MTLIEDIIFDLKKDTLTPLILAALLAAVEVAKCKQRIIHILFGHRDFRHFLVILLESFINFIGFLLHKIKELGFVHISLSLRLVRVKYLDIIHIVHATTWSLILWLGSHAGNRNAQVQNRHSPRPS